MRHSGDYDDDLMTNKVKPYPRNGQTQDDGDKMKDAAVIDADGPDVSPRGMRTSSVVDESQLEVHEDDKGLVADGVLTPSAAKGLRQRRDKLYANEIEGPVHSGRLSKRVFWSYSAPSFSTVPLTVLISVYVVQFYEKIGASLSMVAFFQAFARGLDVITDPTMSYITDSCRSKHGRRRPFLATGCVPYALCLIALMFPIPGFDSQAVGIWFGLSYTAFFLFNTYTNIPYDAMAPELTDNQDDRSKLFFVCTLFDGLGALFAVTLPVGLQSLTNVWRQPNTRTCDEPEGGFINLDSCASNFMVFSKKTLTEAFSCLAWPMADTAENLGYNQSACDSASVIEVGGATSYIGDIAGYCECLDKCELATRSDNMRGSYFCVGLFFGLWYVVSMLNLVRNVKERSQLGGKALKAPPPMVPSMMNTFKNGAFTTLLPAWICDALVNALVQSLLTYFVRYVVQPEFSNPECRGGLSTSTFCSSEAVVGMSALAVLVCALLGTPIWFYIIGLIGKRNTWLLWSFTMAITNSLFLFVGKGDVMLCIIISGINGLPFGAKFLADAILADVIDYDEFLTGARSEATYTMFKSFLPKIAAIPASAIPIALLGLFGHIPPVNGVIQKQESTCLVAYIKVAIIVLPTLLSLCAFFLKLRFPIKTKKQNETIAEGIGLHILGKSAPCPISKHDYSFVRMKKDEQKNAYLLDYFGGSDVAKAYLAEPKRQGKKLIAKATKEVVISICCLIGACGMVAGTWDFLTSDDDSEEGCVPTSSAASNATAFADPDSFCGVAYADGVSTDLSFLPVIGIVFFGVSTTALAFAYMRLKGAKRLKHCNITSVTVQKVILQREQIEACGNFESSVCAGLQELRTGMKKRRASSQGVEMGSMRSKN